MKSPVHIIFLILFAFFYLGSFYAQDLNPAYDVFSVNDGLADNRVNEITQDEKGILWIATQNGLSRYDNFNFFNFSIETDSVFFPDNQVDAFCKSKKYILLLSKSYGAIQLDPLIGSFKWLHRRGILSADVSGDSSVFVFSDGNIEFYLKNKKISTKKVGATPFASVLLNNNKIYFSCDKDGIEVINPFSMKTEGIIPSERMEANGRLLHSVKFGLIYHTGKRVFVINSKNELELHPEFKDKFDITFFCENKTGDPNFINHFKTPFVSAYGFYNKIQFNRKLNAQVKSLFVVSENCFFLSTNQGVLKSMFKYNIAKPIDDNYLFNEDLLRLRKGIVEGPDSSVYLLGYPGILRYKNGGLSLIDTSNLITKTGIIINDRLFCITEGSGLLSFNTQGKIVKTQHITKDISDSENFSSLSLINKDELLLCKEGWLIVFNTKTNESRKLSVKLPSALFKILRDTNDNSFWGCSNEGLIHFSLTPSGQVFREIGKIKIPQSKCNDFLLLPQNKEILIATNTGILIYELNSLKIKKEVPFSFERYPISVLSLLSEKNGRIWTSTSSGIIVYNLKSGEHYALNKSHGLLNTEFCSGSAMQMINGEMMFGGLNTYELLSPLKFDGVKYENDFFISAIQHNKKNGSKRLMKMNGDVSENIELLSGKEQVLIFLANKDLIESANYKFEYRINENSWVLLNRNTPILIADLPYGEHQLQIRMINPFGNKCADKIFLINSVIPFYQRSGFLFTLILLVLGLSVYSYFSFRKTKRISDETKERIAMELHDEAGTVLTRLSLLLSGKSDLNKNRELLASGINEALFSVRTSISSFSQRSFKILILEDGIKEFINKAIVNTDIAWSFRKNYDNDSTISSELYRDIKLCVYEVFTNILKHANCKNIFIELKREKDIMVLKISDDGVITDTKQITEEGNGIGNIRKRIKRNMGDCNFSVSEGGSGLTVELKFPIK